MVISRKVGTYSKHTDNELAKCLMDGDKEAYGELYNRFKGVLYVHACRILQDKEEARDIVQELFTVLWIKHAELEFKNGISSYLYTSVRNRVFDKIARQKVESKYFDSIKDFSESYESIESSFYEKELSLLIEKETAALPPKMRQIFELSRKQNLSHKEIAQQLVLSDQTVKKQVSNAMKILRLKLGNTFLVITSLL